MKKEMMEYSLKLPSSSVVNMKSCWEILKVISKTGKIFKDIDIVNNGSPINEKNLFRVLSYFKYLGFLIEKREKQTINGKEENVQKWIQEDKKDISEFFFLLRDNRESEAKEIFIKIIKEGDLYLSIKNELINNNPSITFIDLKDFLRRKTPNKSPSYYENGTKFVIDLFLFCKLIIKEGNIIKLKEDVLNNNEIKDNIPFEDNKDKVIKENKNLDKNKYYVSIVGENRSYEFPINDITDLEDVEIIINIIKKKLN